MAVTEIGGIYSGQLHSRVDLQAVFRFVFQKKSDCSHCTETDGRLKI
jgi:hypothetical protein